MIKYLALGDSYTIGEGLDPSENFPNQVVRKLLEKGVYIQLEQIIAVTGWTTDELSEAIAVRKPHLRHDWVSLLIGVNNQYRGRSIEEYSWQFYSLLCQAILFAGGKPERVIILSIPDWGLTPFNVQKDKVTVSSEIDQFNQINKTWAEHFGCHYIDITMSTREHAELSEYLAEDQLHYSGNEYAIWAEKVVQIILAGSI
ncbi:MAG: SGNH/GDSL hydrolase family protein [Chitinophagaceae bacterium]|nr:SGNH/GDSL hydrolase family protein [Chitinophagaceae bacterium]